MSLNYAQKLPMDRGGLDMQGYPPPFPSLQTSSYAPPSVSSVVSFTANTTVIEVTALNASLALKWGSGSVISAAGGTANYDHIVPVNQTRRFVIPIQTQGTSSVVGLNTQAGLYNSMAVIACTSVLTGITEY